MPEVRLIDANALEPDTEWDYYYDGFLSFSQSQIDAAPTIEPEVRRGRWIKENNGGGTYSVCSECGAMMNLPWYWYCGKCGARMDGGADNGD